MIQKRFNSMYYKKNKTIIIQKIIIKKMKIIKKNILKLIKLFFDAIFVNNLTNRFCKFYFFKFIKDANQNEKLKK